MLLNEIKSYFLNIELKHKAIFNKVSYIFHAASLS